MLKKESSLKVGLALMVSLSFPSGAFALNYSGSQNNQATFETLEETRVSSPVAVASLETNERKTFKSHPILDGYPKGTTYVYRSANLFGGRAAARLNTNILVFAERLFANKDAALNYLKELGLIKIIDEAIGSVVLVTPSDPKTGFTGSDQKYFYALQTAMLAQKASDGAGGGRGSGATFYSDAEYFGGWGYNYVVGIDGGATFLNNYVATAYEYVNKIAGLKRRIVENFERQQGALHTSALLLDDGIIDPRDTRNVLGFALSVCRDGDARRARPIQFGVARP